jgi:hypothetical protein
MLSVLLSWMVFAATASVLNIIVIDGCSSGYGSYGFNRWCGCFCVFNKFLDATEHTGAMNFVYMAKFCAKKEEKRSVNRTIQLQNTSH